MIAAARLPTLGPWPALRSADPLALGQLGCRRRSDQAEGRRPALRWWAISQDDRAVITVTCGTALRQIRSASRQVRVYPRADSAGSIPITRTTTKAQARAPVRSRRAASPVRSPQRALFGERDHNCHDACDGAGSRHVQGPTGQLVCRLNRPGVLSSVRLVDVVSGADRSISCLLIMFPDQFFVRALAADRARGPWTFVGRLIRCRRNRTRPWPQQGSGWCRGPARRGCSTPRCRSRRRRPSSRLRSCRECQRRP